MKKNKDDIKNCATHYIGKLDRDYLLVRKNAESKAENRRRILNLLKKRLFELKNLNISLEELLYEKPFPKEPFERENSKKFLSAVKNNELKIVKKMLIEDRFLVHNFDFVIFFLSSFNRPDYIGPPKEEWKKW